jgi:hypothetical protein
MKGIHDERHIKKCSLTKFDMTWFKFNGNRSLNQVKTYHRK